MFEAYYGMMWNVVLILTTLISPVILDPPLCLPKHHFWRPFYGEFYEEAFTASQDDFGRKNFVAKIIPLGRYSWTTPAQLNYGNSVPFSWGPFTKTEPVTEQIEILCSEFHHRKRLHWKQVNTVNDMDRIENNCCLVEGAIAQTPGGRMVVSYIGRAMRNMTYFVGAAFFGKGDFLERKGMQAMESWKPVFYYGNFEVLTYNCREGFVPRRKNSKRRY